MAGKLSSDFAPNGRDVTTDKFDWGGFYSGITPSGGAGDGGLTTRPVQSIKVDRFGTPILPTVNQQLSPNNPFVAAANSARTKAQNRVSQQAAAIAQMEYELSQAPAQRWAVDASGKRVDPITLGASSPGPMTPMLPDLPVQSSPEILAAYQAAQSGQPAALKALANLMADSVQAGGIVPPGTTNKPAKPATAPGAGFDAPPRSTPIIPAAPSQIKGSSTGKSYDVGKTYSTKEYNYVATPTGFKNVGRSSTAQNPFDRPGGYNEQRSSLSSLMS